MTLSSRVIVRVAARHYARASLALGLVLGAASSAARAELVWRNTVVELTETFGRPAAVGEFHFENRGSTPINILAVETSCGCTRGTTNRRTYAPGEAGSVSVEFDLTGRNGPQEAKVTVSTDVTQQPQSLILRVNVLQPVVVEPRVIFWKKGEAPQPKSARLHLRDGVRPLKVTSTNAAFVAALQGDITSGYAVTVSPRSTSDAERGAVEVWINAVDEPERDAAKCVIAVYVF